MRSRLSCLCAALLLFSHVPIATAENLNDRLNSAMEEIKSGEYKSAISRLKSAEAQFAGDPDFDYWLGVAYLRDADYANAIFALERVIDKNPNHAGARMELIPAYLQQNMDSLAEHEIKQVEKLNPPPAAREALAQYRKIIDQRREGKKFETRVVMVGLDVGYDSNVSSYPATTLLLPVFNLPIPLAPSGSNFANARFAYWQKFPLKNGDWMSASVSALARRNQDEFAKQYDMDIVQVRGEYNAEFSAERSLRFAVEASQLWLDGESYRTHQGLAVRWQQGLDDKWSWYSEVGVRDFDFEESVNSYRAPWGMLGVRYRLNSGTVWEANLEAEKELADAKRINGDTFRVRANVSFEHQLTQQHRFGLDFHVADVRHDRDYLAGTLYNKNRSDISRRDTVFEYGANWTWYATPTWHWALRGQSRHQTSNLDFYTYRQNLMQLSSTFFF